MNRYKLNFKALGTEGLLVEWPQRILPEINRDIQHFCNEIVMAEIKAVLEINFVYNALLISYNSDLIAFDKLKTKIERLYAQSVAPKQKKYTTWEIPVCYTDEFGLDLLELSHMLGMDKKELIRLHCKNEYTVYGIGFLPGFLYLGGLDKRLTCKRRSSPRVKVPKGAVGIAGSQTGIYPQESPGGWHIIGRSPVEIFNSKRLPPCMVQPGDNIVFCPVSESEYKAIEEAIQQDMYHLKARDND